MRKGLDERDVAKGLLSRSVCRVQVAAVLHDRHGIFSWGWNHSIEEGVKGGGMHAEAHAIRRANPKRLSGATLTVAGRRRKSGNWVYAKPCKDGCFKLAEYYNIQRVQYTTKDGGWEEQDRRYVRV